MVIVPDPGQMMFEAGTFAKAQVRWPGCRVIWEDPSRYISDVGVWGEWCFSDRGRFSSLF